MPPDYIKDFCKITGETYVIEIYGLAPSILPKMQERISAKTSFNGVYSEITDGCILKLTVQREFLKNYVRTIPVPSRSSSRGFKEVELTEFLHTHLGLREFFKGYKDLDSDPDRVLDWSEDTPFSFQTIDDYYDSDVEDPYGDTRTWIHIRLSGLTSEQIRGAKSLFHSGDILIDVLSGNRLELQVHPERFFLVNIPREFTDLDRFRLSHLASFLEDFLKNNPDLSITYERRDLQGMANSPEKSTNISNKGVITLHCDTIQRPTNTSDAVGLKEATEDNLYVTKKEVSEDDFYRSVVANISFDF